MFTRVPLMRKFTFAGVAAGFIIYLDLKSHSHESISKINIWNSFSMNVNINRNLLSQLIMINWKIAYEWQCLSFQIRKWIDSKTIFKISRTSTGPFQSYPINKTWSLIDINLFFSTQAHGNATTIRQVSAALDPSTPTTVQCPWRHWTVDYPIRWHRVPPRCHPRFVQN